MIGLFQIDHNAEVGTALSVPLFGVVSYRLLAEKNENMENMENNAIVNWSWLGHPVKITGFKESESELIMVKISPLEKFPEMFYGSRMVAPLTMMKMMNTDEKTVVVELEQSNDKLLIENSMKGSVLELARRMRDMQKQYFKTKNKSALEEAKRLEREFDLRMKKLETPNLFD